MTGLQMSLPRVVKSCKLIRGQVYFLSISLCPWRIDG